MILVDTSIWIDHFRADDAELAKLLDDEKVLVHPFVIGEVALGFLRRRDAVVSDMKEIQPSLVADYDDVLRMIEADAVFGTGIGYVDTHLLAATRLTPGALLWTRDRRLANVASRLSLAWGLPN